MSVSLRIEGRTFIANLICLPLSGLDIILGMDSLSANHVILNCSDKTIVFPSILSLEPVTPMNLYLSSLAVNRCGTENQGYVLLLTSVTEADQELNNIPVIREYLDVFPEDIPKFPLEKEIELTIELMSGTGPISIAPYRMSPLELAELKKQIEELLERSLLGQAHHHGELQFY